MFLLGYTEINLVDLIVDRRCRLLLFMLTMNVPGFRAFRGQISTEMYCVSQSKF